MFIGHRFSLQEAACARLSLTFSESSALGALESQCAQISRGFTALGALERYVHISNYENPRTLWLFDAFVHQFFCT